MFASARPSNWELRARSGRSVLVADSGEPPREVDPELLGLSASLVEALHEWARVTEAVTREQEVASAADAELISRRGRLLATRAAAEIGGTVGYVDPLSGKIDRVGQRRPARGLAARPDPLAATPWVTGLTVSAVIAIIVVIALVVVTLGLADVNVLLALAVNLAVAAGFGPSIWLGRRIPVWRWVVFGTAVGIGLAWFALLLSLLG